MHLIHIFLYLDLTGNDIPTLRNVLVIIVNIFLEYFNTVLSMSPVSLGNKCRVKMEVVGFAQRI